MPLILDAAYDAALNRACDTAENLYICSAEPATFTAASSTNKLGTKATPTIGAAQDGAVNGRRRTVAAISDGTVDASGTASHWAITDDSLSELLTTGALSATQIVTSGNTFTLGAFDIAIADAT